MRKIIWLNLLLCFFVKSVWALPGIKIYCTGPGIALKATVRSSTDLGNIIKYVYIKDLVYTLKVGNRDGIFIKSKNLYLNFDVSSDGISEYFLISPPSLLALSQERNDIIIRSSLLTPSGKQNIFRPIISYFTRNPETGSSQNTMLFCTPEN